MKHEILGLVTITTTTKKGLQLQFDISFGTSLKVKGLGKRFVLVWLELPGGKLEWKIYLVLIWSGTALREAKLFRSSL